MGRLIAVVFFLLAFFSSAKAGGIWDFKSWISSSCFNVHLKPKGCIKFKHGRVKFGLKVTYWLPVGIVEVTDKACDFSLGIFPFDKASKLVSPICNQLPYLKSNPNMNSFWESYARYQVHVYTIPSVLYPVVKQLLMTTHFVPCFDFSLGDALTICSSCQSALEEALAPVEALEGKVNQFTEKVKDKVNDLVPDAVKNQVKKLNEKAKEVSDKVNDGLDFGEESDDYVSVVKKAYEKVMTTSSFSPVFFSELVSPIWNVDTLSPDAYTIAPVIQAVVGSGGVLTEGACDLSTTLFRQKLAQLQVGGVDPSFLCVGNWGHGYPRTGIVRHDNPTVPPMMLAGVRFLHLFSTTFPVLNVDVHSVKFQLVKPIKTGCFRLGDHSIGMLNDKNRHRLVFLVWKKFSCCDW